MWGTRLRAAARRQTPRWRPQIPSRHPNHRPQNCVAAVHPGRHKRRGDASVFAERYLLSQGLCVPGSPLFLVGPCCLPMASERARGWPPSDAVARRDLPGAPPGARAALLCYPESTGGHPVDVLSIRRPSMCLSVGSVPASAPMLVWFACRWSARTMDRQASRVFSPCP